ncbi:MAG TPA: OFA family MFS transporter [Anaeromyxobacteraceae bacterium]|nr:OFA family MFS transporter [Anaeromyxobacteraceae bacterium]
MGLNLALGILYAWSVFKKAMVSPVAEGGYGWTNQTATLPYTVAIAMFAVMMIPAGRLQDKLGPRKVALTGGLLTAAGLIVASFSGPTSVLPAIVGFGLLAGTGFGLGYAASTPAAIKWFPPEKKGLITGLVVAGFGIAPVYISPLTKVLLAQHGVAMTFRILGIAFAVTATLFSSLIQNPEKPLNVAKPGVSKTSFGGDKGWRDMVKTPFFYMIWLQYAFAATAGLMIIGNMASIVTSQSGGALKAQAAMFVALLAIFNAGGRIIAGVLSDYIGRIVTLALVSISQASILLFFPRFTTFGEFVVGAAVVGFSYGACLSIFPSTTADTWGTKNMGLNYGVLFTAWGVGGVFGPMLAAKIVDTTGSYQTAYNVASMLLLVSFFLAMLNYVKVEFDIAQREVTIRLGNKKVAAVTADEKAA